MFVSGLLHEALVQLTDLLRFFVKGQEQVRSGVKIIKSDQNVNARTGSSASNYSGSSRVAKNNNSQNLGIQVAVNKCSGSVKRKVSDLIPSADVVMG